MKIIQTQLREVTMEVINPTSHALLPWERVKKNSRCRLEWAPLSFLTGMWRADAAAVGALGFVDWLRWDVSSSCYYRRLCFFLLFFGCHRSFPMEIGRIGLLILLIEVGTFIIFFLKFFWFHDFLVLVSRILRACTLLWQG